MASCSMASAASGFLLTPNVAANTNSGSRSSNLVFFPSKNNNPRLVVRAAEEDATPAPPATAAATPTTTTKPAEGEAPKPKPPPIGPKRGTKVSSMVQS